MPPALEFSPRGGLLLLWWPRRWLLEELHWVPAAAEASERDRVGSLSPPPSRLPSPPLSALSPPLSALHEPRKGMQAARGRRALCTRTRR